LSVLRFCGVLEGYTLCGCELSFFQIQEVPVKAFQLNHAWPVSLLAVPKTNPMLFLTVYEIAFNCQSKTLPTISWRLCNGGNTLFSFVRLEFWLLTSITELLEEKITITC